MAAPRPTGRTPLSVLRLAVAALVAVVVAAGLAAGAPRAEAATPPPASSFVQRSGSTLTLAGAPFRFSGTNVYWLGLDDNVRDAAGAPTYPTKFRVEDAFRAAQAAGGTVVRTWGGLVGCARCIEPTRGTFQDSAFASLDYAVATAARYRQRLLVTLVDNWDYYNGSKTTFTGWRGLGESAFFSDPGVIADYQAYITHVVDHVNPYTGLRYADDPTIMGWETGNEMWCQTCAGNYWDGSWTRAVADHLDRVAPKQLVVDGHGTDPSCRTACLHEPSLDIASVDVVDDHFYPMQVDRVRSSAATASRHGKAYLVGEYAWNGARGGEPLATFLDAVRTSGAAGALTWSVVAHQDTAGFVDHDDGYQYFFPGRTADERARTGTLQAFARAVGAPEPPRWAIPPTPCGVTVTRTATGQALSWRGASPAVAYVVQRLDRGTPGATWQTLTWEATDQRVANGPLWTDSSAAARSTPVAAYRVAGLSASRVLGGFSASADTGTRTACAG